MERLEKFRLEDVPMAQVYRRLRQMEDSGWIASTWDEEASLGPPRRVYHLTTEGDAALADWIAYLDEVQDKIAFIHEVYDRHLAEGRGRFHESLSTSEDT
jgi:DNA-binding PadR family transcriptional regulator